MAGGYPAYHTGFETFDLVDRIYDPEYKMFRACAQLNLRLFLELAEAALLPLRMEPYAAVMEEGLEVLEVSGVLARVRALGIPTLHWEEAVRDFRSGSVFRAGCAVQCSLQGLQCRRHPPPSGQSLRSLMRSRWRRQSGLS
jgi:hypothetical protein